MFLPTMYFYYFRTMIWSVFIGLGSDDEMLIRLKLAKAWVWCLIRHAFLVINFIDYLLSLMSYLRCTHVEWILQNKIICNHCDISFWAFLLSISKNVGFLEQALSKSYLSSLFVHYNHFLNNLISYICEMRWLSSKHLFNVEFSPTKMKMLQNKYPS